MGIIEREGWTAYPRVVAWGCGQPESGRGCYVWLATLPHAYVEQGSRDPPGDRVCQAHYQGGVKPAVMKSASPLASVLTARTGSMTLATKGLLSIAASLGLAFWLLSSHLGHLAKSL